MIAYHSVIREAYRAALADWAASEIDGRENGSNLIQHTASLASVWADSVITEKTVVEVLNS